MSDPVMFEWMATFIAIALLLLCAVYNRRRGYRPRRNQMFGVEELLMSLTRLEQAACDDETTVPAPFAATSVTRHDGELVGAGRRF